MGILPQLLMNALIAGSIYALASAGLSLTFGLLRVLNFAHGHMLMVGAYLFYLASEEMGLGIMASAMFTSVAAVGISLVCFSVFVLPFTRYSLLLTLVTTLALSNILEALVSMSFGVNVKSLSAGSGAQSIEIGGVYVTPLQIGIICSAIVLLGGLAWVIHRSPFGRRVRALSENGPAAEALGISKRDTSYFVFSLSTLFAAIAGVLIGYETNMQPTMGSSYTIKAFAAMILGGLGNVWGTVAGGYILGLVENLSIGLDFGGYNIPAGYKDAFAFLIILLVLLVKPDGIFNKAKRKA